MAPDGPNRRGIGREGVSIRINDTAPDFEADTTEGRIQFHDWIGDGWAVLFSHPKDFTPVCTTELGYMAKIKPEFDKRGVKILGISVDPVEDHHRWVKDIEETQGTAPNYPMIGDTELRSRSSTTCCRPAPARPPPAARRPTTPRCATCSSSGPTRRSSWCWSTRCRTGRNFDEVLRVINSMQLTAKHSVATPANWNKGDDVIVLNSIPTDEARKRFAKGVTEIKPYLRTTPDPSV